MTKPMSNRALAGRRDVLMCAAAAVLMGGAGLPIAHAVEIGTGDPDLKLRWDNTFKYSAGWRVKDFDERVAATSVNPNLDDGDRNFRHKGLISNRLDLLSEFDAAYRNAGFRVSGAAWYDDVYHKHNDNDSPDTVNSVSEPAGRFTDGTKKLHGRKAEFLDAYAYAKFQLGDMPLNVRAGRYTLLYGESLFLGGNGIANAQGPIDVVKALSVPGTQFKEIGMPVGQISAQLAINPYVSVGAYYQLQWRKYRLPASGSYFSFGDIVDAGAESVLTPFGRFPRGDDLKGRDSGQGGVQLKFKLPDSDFEYGLYAARYHDKVPIPQIRVGAAGIQDYSLIYPQGINTYGASVSTVVGETNVAAEVSVRRNTPLAPPGGVLVAGVDNDARRNPAYAIGDSFHANVSWITLFGGTPLFDGAAFIGEVGFNRLTRVTRNREALDPNTTRDASGLRMTFEPQYFQVMPRLDLTVPITVGYSLSGRSAVFSFGPEDGGDVSVGVTAEYDKTWRAGLQYAHYFGRAGGVVGSDGALSFDQVLKDRNFISLTVQRTF